VDKGRVCMQDANRTIRGGIRIREFFGDECWKTMGQKVGTVRRLMFKVSRKMSFPLIQYAYTVEQV